MLPCCRDNHMRLWNLVKGRCQYTSALQQEAELVRFSPSGEVGDQAAARCSVQQHA